MKKLMAVLLVLAVATGCSGSDKSGIQQTSSELGLWARFRSDAVKVTIVRDLDTATVVPSTVSVEAGKTVVIGFSGEVFIKPLGRDYKVVSPAEVIQVDIPGVGKCRLDSARSTEFVAKKTGQLVFSIGAVHMPGTTFFSGKKNGTKFDKGSIKVYVRMSGDAPSGSGVPPQPVLPSLPSMPGMPGVPGMPSGAQVTGVIQAGQAFIEGVLDVAVPEPGTITQAYQDAKTGAGEYWDYTNSTTNQAQKDFARKAGETARAVDRGLSSAEGKAYSTVTATPKKVKKWWETVKGRKL